MAILNNVGSSDDKTAQSNAPMEQNNEKPPSKSGWLAPGTFGRFAFIGILLFLVLGGIVLLCILARSSSSKPASAPPKADVCKGKPTSSGNNDRDGDDSNQPKDDNPPKSDDDEVKQAEKAKPAKDLKTYGRFTVEHQGKVTVVVTDTKRLELAPYEFSETTAAWDYVLKLLKNYATGTDQTFKTNRTVTGAFQIRNLHCYRFLKEQVFKLPRWDVDRHKYVNRQFVGRWRIWMDDELALSEEERVARFKANHPNGYGVVT